MPDSEPEPHHDEIIDAIARHEAEAAAEIVRSHMDLSRGPMTEYLAPVGVPIVL
ncbi:hypothetical protein [Cupriavidus alkaliphilus]|uniref:hypothetical protein n=1 Tax=Cupriavidus alkaliphilus TaxID=942866 RepID=UPI0017C50C07|nr:hypothetical protein [Cupriavidus alkaliphilus]MBB3015747.1 DNA-binding GntR family transcriptional regulator [Cupriavidus alkaliphilus]